MLQLPTREATAHHEAGHAVVSVVLGRSPRAVTIRRRGTSLGHTTYWRSYYADVGDRSDKTATRMRRIALATMAGSVAETIYTGDRAMHDQEDVSAVLIVARHLNESPAEIEAFLTQLAVDAAGLVGAHWDFVVRVASALIRNGRITGGDVRAMRVVR